MPEHDTTTLIETWLFKAPLFKEPVTKVLTVQKKGSFESFALKQGFKDVYDKVTEYRLNIKDAKNDIKSQHRAAVKAAREL